MKTTITPTRSRTGWLTRTFALALLALVGCLLPLSAQTTNLLVNGNFESQPNWGNGVSQDGGYTALTGSQMPGWLIEPGHAVTIHISPGPYLVISNSFSANTDGEGWNGHNANFYQDFTSTAGASYQLAFDWQSWGYSTPPATNAMRVSVTDMVTSNALFAGFYYYDGAAPHPVHHVTMIFAGTGSILRLRIEESPESGYNDNSFVVDDFSITGERAGEAPALYIRQSNNTVTVSWQNVSGWNLEQNDNLANPAGWTTTGYTITSANGTNSITLTPPAGNLFFRLKNR